MADVLQPDDEDIMLRALEEQEARMEKQEAEQKAGEGGAAAAGGGGVDFDDTTTPEVEKEKTPEPSIAAMRTKQSGNSDRIWARMGSTGYELLPTFQHRDQLYYADCLLC